ncbi:TIGR00153 family protein [Candidatus Bipolaricaulota bacterium]|nr:TIGR00153 family protein [Candidatus Bipolaricaulota bacterium]TFH09314.1 MAG: TIGR00153 family protein [Candidatus Atribacteria bacterium]
MLWKRQREIENLVFEHLERVDESLQYFIQSINAYVRDGDIEKADKLALETHRSEGRADDVRRRVEAQLLSGALMPTSRRDILQLVDQVDRLANAAEDALDHLLIQQIKIPDVIQASILEIGTKTELIFAHVKDAIGNLFKTMEAALKHTVEIERLESEIDHIERQILKKLFQQDIDLAHKLQINSFVGSIVELSDRAEDLSDHIELMVAQKHL